MKKIKELSEAILKSGGLEDLRDKIAVTNKKLEELQSGEDATDALSSLQSEVVAVKKEVKELSRKVGNDGKLIELQSAIDELQKLTPRIDSLQGLRKAEVAGINKKLQKLQEAVTSLDKRKSDANLAIYDERRISEQIEQVEWELRRELSVESDVQRDTMQMQNQQLQQRFPDLEGLRYFMVYIAIMIFSAYIVWCICDSTFVRKEALQDLQQKF